MIIEETLYNKMPNDLQALFIELPNIHKEEVLSYFPKAGGQQGDLVNHNHKIISPNGIYGTLPARNDTYKRNEEETSAARFFYCSKPSPSERNFGLEEIEEKRIEGRDVGQDERNVPYKSRNTPRSNQHPTVKSIKLMSYLCKLITPQNGIILDPFMGSGSTGIGAKLEGFNFIGIEKEEDYFKIAEARIKAWQPESKVNSKFKNIQRSKLPSPKSDYPSFF